VERSETSEKTQQFLSQEEDQPGFPNNAFFYFHFFVFLDVLFRTFDVILQ
jgi:hypothetical protein